MRLKVLGSAAGGGVPQWNCNFRYSRSARRRSGSVVPRLQSSLAASADRERGWVVFNASPDIRQQIGETPELQPAPSAPPRSTPIRAVVLTNADVDHLAGLLSLRERQAFNLYATERVLKVLAANPIFRVLDPDYVERVSLQLGIRQPLRGPDGETGLIVELFSVPGKVALFMESGAADADFEADDGDTIGVQIEAAGGGGRAFYIPGCARIDPDLAARVAGCDVLLFDGTVFRDDEMAAAGVGTKTGRRMGHLPIADPEGPLAVLSAIGAKRKVFIHVNNTNPILDERSAERRIVEDAGWEVASDGMEFDL